MAFYRKQNPIKSSLPVWVLAPFVPSDQALLRSAFTQELTCIEYKADFRKTTAEHDLMAEPARDGTLIGSRERRVFVWWNYLRWRLMQEVEKCRHRIIGLPRCVSVLQFARREYHVKSAILKANEGLVHRVVQKFRPRADEYDDYLSEARCAMLQAMSKFDGKTGAKFAGFACTAMRRRIIDQLRAKKIHEERYGGCVVDDPIVDADPSGDAEAVDRLREVFASNEASLTNREAKVIRLLYGIEGGRVATNRAAARLLKITQAELATIRESAFSKLARVLSITA